MQLLSLMILPCNNRHSKYRKKNNDNKAYICMMANITRKKKKNNYINSELIIFVWSCMR